MQQKWIIKALVQKSISFLPFKYDLNFFFQKHVTRGVELTSDYFNDRLIHARNHIKYFTELTGKSIPSKTLELGTGWYPVIPIYLFLRGVNNIYTIDIADHIKKNYTLITIKKFIQEFEKGTISHEIDKFIPERVKWLMEVSKESNKGEHELLSNMGIIVKVNDARTTIFSDEHFDLIHSNNTFEHIYPNELKQIIEEFLRILKKGGVMSHFIDMTDHFAHFDKSISIYNFLKYSDSHWRLIDNSIQPQNRLRIKDYLEMYKKYGIEFEIKEIRDGNIDDLKSMKVNKKFRDFKPEEMAISHCQFISRK